MRFLRWVFLLPLAGAIGCQHRQFLPSTTLRQRAPDCGAFPVAPRPGDTGPAFFACQVDRPITVTTQRRPRYPALMLEVGLQGTVVVQFVVDTGGRVDTSTLQVIGSTHELFTEAVLAALWRWRVPPAVRQRKAVRQLVTHGFCFRTGEVGDRIGLVGATASCREELDKYGRLHVTGVCYQTSYRIWRSHGGSSETRAEPRACY